MAQVKNLHGTSDNSPPIGYSTWKEWWEHKKGKKFYYCSNSVCLNKAEVGAHVQKHSSSDRKWYIVPLCIMCNKKTDEFEVSDNDLQVVDTY